MNYLRYSFSEPLFFYNQKYNLPLIMISLNPMAISDILLSEPMISTSLISGNNVLRTCGQFMNGLCYCFIRTYDQYVNGGTPFEKGIEVDPSIGRKSELSLYQFTLKKILCNICYLSVES